MLVYVPFLCITSLCLQSERGHLKAIECYLYCPSFRDLIDQYGVCFRVLGNLILLPEDIQRIIAEGIESTKHNTK